jgi:hypothetical protein
MPEDVTPRILVDRYQCFGQDVTSLFQGTKRKKQIPQKGWYHTRLHHITSRKTPIFIIASRPS